MLRVGLLLAELLVLLAVTRLRVTRLTVLLTIAGLLGVGLLLRIWLSIARLAILRSVSGLGVLLSGIWLGVGVLGVAIAGKLCVERDREDEKSGQGEEAERACSGRNCGSRGLTPGAWNRKCVRRTAWLVESGSGFHDSLPRKAARAARYPCLDPAAGA